MPATQTSDVKSVEQPNFDTVWAILQENARQMEEYRRERERERKFERERERKQTERKRKQTERKREEAEKKWKLERERERKEFNARLGALTNLFGDFTYGMVAPKLSDKFYDLGYNLHTAIPNYYINDKVNKIYLEIDVMLQNGDKAMLVELKTKLTIERIKKHIERLEKMRKHADLHGDKRTFLGAVAGFAVTDKAREYALKEGFYLIEPDGDNFNITPPNDKPKEW